MICIEHMDIKVMLGNKQQGFKNVPRFDCISLTNTCAHGIQCRIDLEQARLLVLEAADQLDRHGNKKARGILAMAKVNHSSPPLFFF